MAITKELNGNEMTTLFGRNTVVGTWPTEDPLAPYWDMRWTKGRAGQPDKFRSLTLMNAVRNASDARSLMRSLKQAIEAMEEMGGQS